MKSSARAMILPGVIPLAVILPAMTVILITTMPFRAATAATIAFLIDPAIGVRVAVASAQSLLATPPLPRLDGGKSFEVPASATYITATSSLSDKAFPGATAEGKFTGQAFGLGFVSKDKSGLRYFAWFLANQLSGQVELTGSGAGGKAEIPDLKASGFASAIGVGYRLLGDAKSAVAFGIFTAPAFISLKSSFSVTGPGAPTLTFATSPIIYGMIGGAQINIKIRSFLLNPYYLYFKDFSQECRDISTNAPNGGFCTQMSGTFSAAGVNVGYNGLVFTAYSAVLSNENPENAKIQNYSISYSFGFE